jgi:hypothetical protein
MMSNSAPFMKSVPKRRRTILGILQLLRCGGGVAWQIHVLYAAQQAFAEVSLLSVSYS